MANIMVNEACNLDCPYCFAGEFVGQTAKEMTVEDFRTALNFALSDTEEKQVGIIGGEPLLYADTVCAAHEMAGRCGIEKKQLITNGYFTNDDGRRRQTAWWWA